jgi:hypothetical protein
MSASELSSRFRRSHNRKSAERIDFYENVKLGNQKARTKEIIG